MTFDAKKIFDEVKANMRTLEACERHAFAPGAPALGQKWECLHCGGRVDATFVMAYCAGYAAAGGDPVTIWPDIASARQRVREAVC